MSRRLGKPRAFRQWQEIQGSLEFAESKGLNVSEIINRSLLDSANRVIREALMEKKREAEEALAALVS